MNKELLEEVTHLKNANIALTIKNRELKKQLSIHSVINWVAYDWNNPSTRPPKAGRYLIYRSKCNKLHFEQWNGSGWASSNNDCTHYTLVEPPCL